MKTLFIVVVTCMPLLATQLIRGTPVTPGSYTDVVRIRSNGAGCTATVVGRRVILTAAHCANTGAEAIFKVGEKEYSAKMTRSSIYPNQDHDLALGVTSEDIVDIKPASIGGAAVAGGEIILLGYGCTKSDGTGGNDGVLREGKSKIVYFSGYDMVSQDAKGAALCFGDSGGPAFIASEAGRLLLGVNSKGNIYDTNYNARTDLKASVDFFEKFAQKNSVEICGVTEECAPLLAF